MSTTYGIDLGTTYSCLAQVSELSDDVGEVIANRDNDSTTPSVVLVDQGEVIVGRQAKNMARVKPENVARLFKPDMGSEHPFCEIAGKEYWAHELSSLVLKKLVADAADQGHDVQDVVITVPAYFGFLERSATKLAGELAGLNVIGVIPEPTAAAVAYGLRLDPEAPAKTLLVYDLGGGTFDVSVVVCEGGSVRVVTTEGDHELGGSQWDEALVEHVIGRFLQDNPAAADPRSSPHDDQELLSQVEQLKQALTERESSEVVVRSGAAMGIVEVTRAEFEEVTALLLSQTIDMTRTAISDVEAKGHRIDEILLVGGSSKMPQVKRAVQAELGLEPQLRDPDLAVAKGAALAADRIAQFAIDDGSEPAGGDGPSGERAPRGGLGSGAGLIQDVCPWSFGLLVVENDTRVIRYMVERNEPIPARVERTFSTTVDDQTAIASGIYQQQPGAPGSTDPEENVLILDFTVEGIATGFAKGTPVDITFVMDQSGLITVEAHHQGRAEPAVVTASVALGGVSAEDSASKLAHLAVRA